MLQCIYKEYTTMVLKEKLAAFATISAVFFGAAGMALPPMGAIDKSVLYIIAQLLIFAATLLGFGSTVEKVTKMVDEIKNKRCDNENKPGRAGRNQGV